MTGKQLRTTRRKLGLTQAQLAERLGVWGNTVARWERGTLRITERTERLVRLLVEMHTVPPLPTRAAERLRRTVAELRRIPASLVRAPKRGHGKRNGGT